MKADFEFDKYITDAMKEEPGFFLSSGFADKLTEKVNRRYALRESLKEYSVYAAVFLSLAFIVFAFLLFINRDNLQYIQLYFSRYLTEIISLVFIANFILFTDKVILRILFTLK
ncbi:MAG: hypothetical protein RBS73_17970 [Prolixibacteraceae bacterium]|jgi:hypothetical protein|nr:hypothetical protein [Prolixibacteraceae bacterium]